MHDIDNVRFEADNEFEAWSPGIAAETDEMPLEFEEFEFEDTESALFGEADAGIGEMDETDPASELLDVQSEEELDQFIGSLIRRAGQAIRSPAGRAIGGLLKKAAKRALPGIGAVLGGHMGGARGAQAGRQLASSAGRLFGLELEGLSGEDQEYEVARRFVRFSDAAARNLAAQTQRIRNPSAAARAAFVTAARRHAPGLLGASSAAMTSPAASAPGLRPQSGRWVRRGNKIVVLGL